MHGGAFVIRAYDVGGICVFWFFSQTY